MNTILLLAGLAVGAGLGYTFRKRNVDSAVVLVKENIKQCLDEANSIDATAEDYFIVFTAKGYTFQRHDGKPINKI